MKKVIIEINNKNNLFDTIVRGLISGWAPLVWLAPGERFLPLSVPEFLEHVQVGDNYLRTRVDVSELLTEEFY